MYAVRLWSVRHAKGLNAFYRAFEKALIALHPLWNKIGYEKLEKPFEGVEQRDQGLPVRLPDVRAVRALLHRHVVPDELPEEPAQRPVRRRARQRPLRSEAGDEVRVGAGLGRRRPHGPQGRGRPQDPRRAARGRPSPQGQVVLAAGGAHRRRSARTQAGNKPKPPAAKPGGDQDLAAVSASVQAKKRARRHERLARISIRRRRCRCCPGIPRAGGWSVCCGWGALPSRPS